MPDAKSNSTSREEWRQARTKAIREFVTEYAPSENADLFSQLLVTMCRLAADEVDRGDLKILNTAMKELRYAFKVFAPYQDIPKVSIFGSARTEEDHPQYRQAQLFAELIQREGWMVITGAGSGIMQAGHHGATRESSFGVAISLPFEQETNEVIADDPKLVNFKYFFTRKLVFMKEAKAIVLFPGGVGTQDEGFEALTLVQTSKTAPTPIVLCDEPGGSYWLHWKQYITDELLGNGMIDAEDMHLFHVTDDAQDAVREVVHFYRNYHSSRYIGDLFAIRLKKPLSSSLLTEVQRDFSDLLLGGSFEQSTGPLKDEDGEYPDLPRLCFRYDRRSAGRLRLLINRLNDAGL